MAAAVWSFANTVFVRLVGLVGGVVLARLVAPDQFGLFATALIVFTILISVSEMGVTVALIRETGSVSKIGPTVTTLALTSSAALTLACVGLAPYFAAWMKAPQATILIQVMALGLLLAGASAVPNAVTQRTFRQDKKALAEGLASIVSIGLGIALAVLHMGAWALVWSRLAGLATTTLILMIVVKERFAPGFDRSEARRLIKFGVPLAGASLLVFVVMNVDFVIVGRILGTESLGFYSLAFNIASWPVAALSAPARSVSVAWLSNLRDNGHDPGYGFAKLLGPLMLITIPACVLLSLVAEPFISFAYGAKWLPAALPLLVLAPLGILRVALEVCYDTLVSSGDTRRILLVHVSWLVLLVPALVLGAHLGGLVGVAVAQIVVVLFATAPLYLRGLQRLGVSVRLVMRVMVRPILGGVAMCGIGVILKSTLTGDLQQILTCTLVGGAAYVAVAFQRPMQWRARRVGGVGHAVKSPKFVRRARQR